MVAAMWALAVLGVAEAASADHQTCGDIKTIYKAKACCGNPDKLIDMQVVPRPEGKMLAGDNICANKKVPLDNIQCLADKISEQSGVDVSPGVNGQKATNATPIMSSYMDAGLCPVNVHWHLGAEHKNVGVYDDDGKSPAGRRLSEKLGSSYHRNLGAEDVRYGGKCYHYNAAQAKFTTEYEWKHCVGMHVGDTYEVHWPHSKAGACGTPNQFQTPFYDGVFCRFGTEAGQVNLLDDLPGRVGVQAQVFTIVNDETYFYPDLMRGMIIDGDHGKDMAHYTGSTTGTSRSNEICSAYTPITWQVDRKCHLISASSFDKMCADMKMQRDDMSGDLHAHGAREVVLPEFAASNMASAGAPDSSR
jgi:hypothetical protein